jgi:hypothetical protein
LVFSTLFRPSVVSAVFPSPPSSLTELVEDTLSSSVVSVSGTEIPRFPANVNSHRYGCRYPDWISKLRHVYRFSIPHWFWCCHRIPRLSHLDHRARFSHPPGWCYFALQLILVPRLYHCRLVHLRNFPNRIHLGLANPFRPSSFGSCHSARFHLVHPRIPTMAC